MMKEIDLELTFMTFQYMLIASKRLGENGVASSEGSDGEVMDSNKGSDECGMGSSGWSSAIVDRLLAYVKVSLLAIYL